MRVKSYLFLILFFCVPFSLQAYAMPGKVLASTKAEIQQSDEKPSDSETHNLLFSVHHQSERALHSSTSNSLLTAENDTEEDTYGTRSSEKQYRWFSSYYLETLGIVEISLTVKEVIFPFHSHL